MVKIAFIRDRTLLEALEGLDTADSILERPEIVRRAIRNKVEVVLSDPYETSDQRALLNFGHTIGHAIEAASEYRIPHGECVAIGMVAETEVALRQSYVESSALARLSVLLTRLGLPTMASDLATIDPSRVLEALLHDKKRRGGRIRMVMLTGVGTASVQTVTEDDIVSAVASLQMADVATGDRVSV